MGDGRFRFPKTIELEELSVERTVPKSESINTLNRLLLDMCEAAGIKRKTAHCFRVTGASVYNITVSGEVEKFLGRWIYIPRQFVSRTIIIVL